MPVVSFSQPPIPKASGRRSSCHASTTTRVCCSTMARSMLSAASETSRCASSTRTLTIFRRSASSAIRTVWRGHTSTRLATTTISIPLTAAGHPVRRYSARRTSSVPTRRRCWWKSISTVRPTPSTKEHSSIRRRVNGGPSCSKILAASDACQTSSPSGGRTTGPLLATMACLIPPMPCQISKQLSLADHCPRPTASVPIPLACSGSGTTILTMAHGASLSVRDGFD